MPKSGYRFSENIMLQQWCQRAMTLPWKSRLTVTGLPSFMALPRHTPLSSFLRSDTLLKPFDSMRDLAWPSVKLLAPATGWFELLAPLVFTAGLLGRDCAGGFWFCAAAALTPSASAAATRTVLLKVFGIYVPLCWHYCLEGTIPDSYGSNRR